MVFEGEPAVKVHAKEYRGWDKRKWKPQTRPSQYLKGSQSFIH